MPKKSRWQEAQSYEKSFWRSVSEGIEKEGKEKLSWYKWRTENLAHMLKKAFKTDSSPTDNKKILEIGSGPVGMISFLDAAERVAIDPLCDYYSQQPSLIEYRNPEVVYKNGKGEELPYEAGHFDMVIIENVIDHTEKPGDVLREIHRVLGPDGIMFLTVNIHLKWGAFMHQILADLKIDKGHPYTFTLDKIRAFLTDNQFSIAYDEWEEYKSCRNKDLKSPRTKDKIKGVAGLSEFLYTSVNVKKSNNHQ